MDAIETVFYPVSSFHDYQFDAIISAIELAEIPLQIEFFVSAFGDAFNLFIPQQYIEQAVGIAREIETSGVIYDKSVAIEKYHTARLRTAPQATKAQT